MKTKVCKPRDHEWDEQDTGVWLCLACSALLVSPGWIVELSRPKRQRKGATP